MQAGHEKWPCHSLTEAFVETPSSFVQPRLQAGTALPIRTRLAGGVHVIPVPNGGDEQVWGTAARAGHQGIEPFAQLHKREPSALQPSDVVVEDAATAARLLFCAVGAHALPP